MDIPGRRLIRIANSKIGLIGLDQAISRLLKEVHLNDEEAVKALFAEIQKLNYIPTNLEEQYKEALRQEFERSRQGTSAPEADLIIRVLGKPCVSCNKLGIMVIEALNTLKIAADVEQIHDPDEIWRYGVFNTPALIVNNEIKSAGRLPTQTEIEQWLTEAASP